MLPVLKEANAKRRLLWRPLWARPEAHFCDVATRVERRPFLQMRLGDSRVAVFREFEQVASVYPDKFSSVIPHFDPRESASLGDEVAEQEKN